ncbi:MAG: hypothetical protein JSV96_18635 [Candidatus Aminicenantes bacterium]|nr:MAG: hypothetical protein JSV96_18635 [Candidatus Aminicenantes bacterium]
MLYLLVRHRVADFDKWYSVFKSHAEAQREAGLKDLQLLRDAADPNIIVCLFKVDDVQKARAFTGSREAGDAQRESGIIGEPEILLLDEI